MVRLCHFEVAVLQDGIAVNEYADPLAEESPDIETRYIEVKEGKSFAIRLNIDQHFNLDKHDALAVEVMIDGEKSGDICY